MGDDNFFEYEYEFEDEYECEYECEDEFEWGVLDVVVAGVDVAGDPVDRDGRRMMSAVPGSSLGVVSPVSPDMIGPPPVSIESWAA